MTAARCNPVAAAAVAPTFWCYPRTPLLPSPRPAVSLEALHIPSLISGVQLNSYLRTKLNHRMACYNYGLSLPSSTVLHRGLPVAPICKALLVNIHAGMAAFSYPSLKVREIVQCMNELHIPTVEADLRDPQVCAPWSFAVARRRSLLCTAMNRDGSAGLFWALR